MSNQPLVTVNILSHNREHDLSNTLNRIYDQTYKNIEVIVVDNASSDATSEMIKNNFHDVKLINLKKNIGIAGWNEGFKVSEGDFILVLDDDSYPEKNTLSKAVKSMQSDLETGVVCLPVYNKRFKIYESDYINKTNPTTFIGCGALIRRNIFMEAGCFSEILFLYEHETEFSMRVINSGYKIKYCPDALIIHENSVTNRDIKNKSDRRRKFYLSRNYLIILFMHFNFLSLIIFVPQLIVSRLIMAIVEKNFLTTASGFSNALKSFPWIMKNRQPLKNNVQKIYNSGNYMGRFVRERFY